jgi:hypothetical protein
MTRNEDLSRDLYILPIYSKLSNNTENHDKFIEFY